MRYESPSEAYLALPLEGDTQPLKAHECVLYKFTVNHTLPALSAQRIFEPIHSEGFAMFSFFRTFPALIIPVALYNALIGAPSSDADAAENLLARTVGNIPMPVNATSWTIHTADLIMLTGLIALFFEVIGSGRSSNGVLVKHVLNMLLFIVCLIEFLLLKSFATSSFFLLLTLSLMATISGFVISTVTARKDIEFAH